MVRRWLACLALSFCVLGGVRVDAKLRPAVVVDPGACPFECCTYREWWTDHPLPIYSRPDRRSRRLRTLEKGEHVRALTGFVRTRAHQFIVTRDNGRYHRGDILWVYAYRGEGFFNVWFKGRAYDEDLGFSPYGGSSGARGDVGQESWGHLTVDHTSVWWTKVRLRDGRIGWTDQGDVFENTDSCG